MDKWKNKKTFRGIIIGLIVVVTAVVVVANTKITPAKSEGDTTEIVQETGEKKTSKKSDKSGDAKKTDSRKEEVDGSDTGLADKQGISNETGTSNGKTTEKESGSSTDSSTDNDSANQPENGTNNSSSENTENKPEPQPEKNITCSITITCDAISGNGKLTAAGHSELEPYAANATILGTTTYTVKEGTSAYDILKQACDANGIQIDATYNATYNTSYVKGINYLYEFSAGAGSGWMYQVNGVSPNRGASSYKLSEGDVVTWYYVAR